MSAAEVNVLQNSPPHCLLGAISVCRRPGLCRLAETIVDRVERRFDLKPERLAGDTAYGAAKLLKWLWDRGITPHVPVWNKSARSDGKFSRADFVFDKERNVYICPAGAELTNSGIIDQGRILPYRASHRVRGVSVKWRRVGARALSLRRPIHKRIDLPIFPPTHHRRTPLTTASRRRNHGSHLFSNWGCGI
jgi:hypothetical protein